MGAFFGVLAVSAMSLAAALAMGRVRQKSRDDHFNAKHAPLAHALGLTFVPMAAGVQPRMFGVVDRIPVDVHFRVSAGFERFGWVEVSAKLERTLSNVSFRSVSGPSALYVRLSGQDVKTGDAAFDSAYRVRGEPGEALAKLSDALRRELLTHTDRVLALANQRLMLETREEDLESDLEALLALARRDAFSDERSIPARLAENAVDGTDLSVRRRNLEILQHDYADTPPYAETLEALETDDDQLIRLFVDLSRSNWAGLAQFESDWLLEVASTATDNLSRLDALIALGHVGEPSHAESLEQLLPELSQPAIQEALAEAVARIEAREGG